MTLQPPHNQLSTPPCRCELAAKHDIEAAPVTHPLPTADHIWLRVSPGSAGAAMAFAVNMVWDFLEAALSICLAGSVSCAGQFTDHDLLDTLITPGVHSIPTMPMDFAAIDTINILLLSETEMSCKQTWGHWKRESGRGKGSSAIGMMTCPAAGLPRLFTASLYAWSEQRCISQTTLSGSKATTLAAAQQCRGHLPGLGKHWQLCRLQAVHALPFAAEPSSSPVQGSGMGNGWDPARSDLAFVAGSGGQDRPRLLLVGCDDAPGVSVAVGVGFGLRLLQPCTPHAGFPHNFMRNSSSNG